MSEKKKTALVEKLQETVKPQTPKAEKVENTEKPKAEAPKAEAPKKETYKVVHQNLPSVASALAPLPGVVPEPVYVPIPKVKSNG